MDQQAIETIVRRVIEELNHPGAGSGKRGIYSSLDDAVAAATMAQKKIHSIALRERIIEEIRAITREHARELSEMAVRETGFGRVEDKVRKHLLVANKTPGPEVVVPMVMSGDYGLSLMENAAWGVIASVTPSTNPSATVVNNSISMIAAGNAVVFAPHPAAKAVSQRAVQLVNEASVRAGPTASSPRWPTPTWTTRASCSSFPVSTCWWSPAATRWSRPRAASPTNA